MYMYIHIHTYKHHIYICLSINFWNHSWLECLKQSVCEGATYNSIRDLACCKVVFRCYAQLLLTLDLSSDLKILCWSTQWQTNDKETKVLLHKSQFDKQANWTAVACVLIILIRVILKIRRVFVWRIIHINLIRKFIL